MATAHDDAAFERRLARLELAERSFKRYVTQRRDSPFFTTDLTIQQLRTLVLLGTEGAQPTHELAELLGVGVTTVTGMIDRLASRDLVRRVPDPNDRRVRKVELTDGGRRLYEEMDETGRSQRRRILAQVEPRIVDNLIEAMEAIQAVLENLPDDGGEGGGNGEGHA